MQNNIISHPELYFCLVGPVGADLDGLSGALEEQLRRYDYKIVPIHVTEIMHAICPVPADAAHSLNVQYDHNIVSANWLREKIGNRVMANLAMMRIREERAARAGAELQAAAKTAFIVRQFKRTEEIDLFRKVYGKLVFQVSAYADPELREERLVTKMRERDPSATRDDDFRRDAQALIRRDSHEDGHEFGQRVRDVFPMADVFVDTSNKRLMEETVERFVKIIFGYNFHSPTHDEYGMYMAKSASLRSLDLSRQVGAAVFSNRGEIRTFGCNEVPSPRGGTYWEGDRGDAREFTTGRDTNDDFKYRLLADVVSNLAQVGIVDESYKKKNPREFIKEIKERTGVDLSKKLMMMDIIEYGRIIHAEMNAITDAARRGISLDNAVLFCTTFPCHLCAKHIIASGIKRVVYIEPYPKSYTKELYKADISLEKADREMPEQDRVYFEPFIGIAPFRYRDLFENGKRKKLDGTADSWRHGEPRPVMEITSLEYLVVEVDVLRDMLKAFAARQIPINSPYPRPEGDPTELCTPFPAELSVPAATSTTSE